MGRAYSDIAFTPAVRDMQTRMGTRSVYAALDRANDRRDALTTDEIAFIHERDAFYQATVSESGWPNVQHRGGPAGFLKVLDAKTIGYADLRANVQYISVGNLHGNDRVSILLMDHANQRRLKILGRVRLVDAKADPALITRLQMPSHLTGSARLERAVIISVEGYDWNCPQHITPRFTRAEIEESIAPLRAEIEQLKRAQAGANTRPVAPDLGQGPLALRVSGIRQLTPRIRAYELHAANGADLPVVRAGAALEVPVRLKSGVLTTRRYSIASDPGRRDVYEIAVLREQQGRGASDAVHSDFELGMTLHCAGPVNNFALHVEDRPVVLIAGGIGITPIKAMAHQLRAEGRRFELHYAVRSRGQAAYLAELEQMMGASLFLYAGEHKQRFDASRTISLAAANTVFYVCGPQLLIDAVRKAGSEAGLSGDAMQFERFSSAAVSSVNRPLTVTLHRSGKRVPVTASQSVLDAIEAAGVAAPYGCRSGTCGTCQVNVLEGRPEHRDDVLTGDQRDGEGLMCICVSRAVGADLTLDLLPIDLTIRGTYQFSAADARASRGSLAHSHAHCSFGRKRRSSIEVVLFRHARRNRRNRSAGNARHGECSPSLFPASPDWSPHEEQPVGAGPRLRWNPCLRAGLPCPDTHHRDPGRISIDRR